MELWQAAVNVVVGAIVMGVGQLLKKYTAINMPIVKFIMVLVLAGGAGIGMGWIYSIDMTAAELARQAMVVALGAIGFKSMFKSGG